MSEAIVITSGKGGAGKSLVTAGVAAQLARRKQRVAVIDMDVGLRSLDILFRLENSVVYDIADVLDGICPMKQAIMRVKAYEGVFLINAPQFGDSSAISVDQMDGVVDGLKKEYDFVLIDCPAGVGRGFHNASAAADRALLVTIPEPICIRDAERAIGLMELKGMDRIDLVLNRVRPCHMQKSAAGGVHRAEEALNHNVIGVVPEDPSVAASNARGTAGDLCAHASGAAFDRIARRLMGESVPLHYPKAGLGARMRSLFGREG